MKIVIVTAFLLVSSILMAAEETEVWACQSTDINGFAWIDGKWERRAFTNRTFLFTFDFTPNEFNPSLHKQTLEGRDYYFSCTGGVPGTTLTLGSPYASCSAIGKTFFLNLENGEGALSDLTSAVTSSQLRDEVFVELVQCTKF